LYPDSRFAARGWQFAIRGSGFAILRLAAGGWRLANR